MATTCIAKRPWGRGGEQSPARWSFDLRKGGARGTKLEREGRVGKLAPVIRLLGRERGKGKLKK